MSTQFLNSPVDQKTSKINSFFRYKITPNKKIGQFCSIAKQNTAVKQPVFYGNQ